MKKRNRKPEQIENSAENTSGNFTASTAEAINTGTPWLEDIPKQPSGKEEDTSSGIMPKKKKRAHKVLLGFFGVTLVAAIGLIIAAIAYQKIYYGNRWYQGTSIDGIDVSGQTLEESKMKLRKKYSDYALVIKGRENGSLTINGDDIGYQFDISSNYDQLYETQHQAFRIFPATNHYTLDFAVSYDKEKLSEVISQSAIVSGSDSYKISPPETATVKFSKEKQQYIYVDEVKGNKIVTDKLLDAIDECLRQAQTALDITDENKYPGLYETATSSADKAELDKMLKACNNAALRYITWTMENGVKEQITPAKISKWITYKNGKIKYKKEAIEKWVKNFCLKYKTVGIDRKVKTHNKKTITVKGGDYGWQLDYDKTLKQANKALKTSIEPSVTDSFIENPSKSNKKALTFRNKVNYLNTAYQMDTENPENDWDRKNYTEISLKDQKVYVYRKGKRVFSCRCITGRPVEGRKTPTGAFFIKEHREQYTLTGADYKTPVTNWVRITWSGTGFHPATWQPWSRWTKDLYQTKGSHGCINLEPKDAAKIYQLTNYREFVFIY